MIKSERTTWPLGPASDSTGYNRESASFTSWIPKGLKAMVHYLLGSPNHFGDVMILSNALFRPLVDQKRKYYGPCIS